MAITTTVDSLGQLLKVWHEGAHLTLKRLAPRASGVLAEVGMSVSYGTLHRYELNRFGSEGPDPFVLVAVALACDRQVADYPDEVKTLMTSQMLRTGSRCTERGPGGGHGRRSYRPLMEREILAHSTVATSLLVGW